MKFKHAVCLLIFALNFSCEQDETFPISKYACEDSLSINNEIHPKNDEYKQLMKEIVQSGAPGLMFSIKNKNQPLWSSALGKADLASYTDLQVCNITRAGSIVKTFTAVTLLLLQEEGKLDLDDKISEYLDESKLNGLPNAKEATIRQILQHSSGIPNYITSLNFQTASLNDLEKVWQPNELVDYAREQDALFALGSDVSYSNTGYILAGDLISVVEGQPFYKVFEEKIFTPLKLNYTSFAAENPVPDNLIRGYVDLYSNLNVINSTYYSGWDYFTADGGLISNPYDLNKFAQALFGGNVISASSMSEMLDWIPPNEQDEENFETFYGLGTFKINTKFGMAYIHSGDAIGYFASMVYFPTHETTITWASNGNYGKIDDFTQSKEAMERIFEVIME